MLHESPYGKKAPLADGWYKLPGPSASEKRWVYRQQTSSYSAHIVWAAVQDGRLVGATGTGDSESFEHGVQNMSGFTSWVWNELIRLLNDWNDSMNGRLYSLLEQTHFPQDDWKDELIVRL